MDTVIVFQLAGIANEVSLRSKTAYGEPTTRR